MNKYQSVGSACMGLGAVLLAGLPYTGGGVLSVLVGCWGATSLIVGFGLVTIGEDGL